MLENKEKDFDEFAKELQEHGIRCGLEISKLAKDMHPDAISIIPLYRSCIVIEQTEEDKKDGIAVIHAYADPHWLGKDITIEELKSDDFYSKSIVQGMRHGPEISLVEPNNYQKMIIDQKYKEG